MCWANRVGHRGRRHRLSDHHRRHHRLPALPSRGAYHGDVRGRKRAWWRSPRRRHSAIAVLWKGMRSEREDVFMSTTAVGYYTAWKWIRISLESRMVSWYKNEIVQAGVSNCMHHCLNFSLLKRTHSRVPWLKGEAIHFSSFFTVCR